MQVKLRSTDGEPVDFHECATLAEMRELVGWLTTEADVYLEGTGEATAEVSLQVVVSASGRSFVEVIFHDDEE